MKRIAILGPGLLGGSIALKLRALGGFHVTAWARRPEAVAEVLAAGCADAATADLGTAVKDAELVILCVPVGAMAGLVRAFLPSLGRDAIVTDVGSVKSPVLAAMNGFFAERGRFVGSHPMAGSEHHGLKAARADLFERSTCIVTPEEATDVTALAEVKSFWGCIGCRVVELAASEHDECVALVSHLPHVLAATLIHTVAERNAHAFGVVGPGFRDTTRVASGPPAMWTEILGENAPAVVAAIDALIAKLSELRQTLGRAGDGRGLHEFLAAAKSTRDRISFPK
jgi:prephenate dehydrogenase